MLAMFPLAVRRALRAGAPWLLWVGLLLWLSAEHARGEDEAPVAETEWIERFFDLEALRSPPASTGALLATPADLVGRELASEWNQDPGDDRIPWVPFSEGSGPAAYADLLIAQLSSWLPADLSEVPGAMLGERDGGVWVRVPRAWETHLDGFAAWLDRALFQTLEVEVVLERLAPEASWRALGRAKVLPGRWTPLVFRKEEWPCVVAQNGLVAQHTVAFDPIVENIVEGHEVHVRYQPGIERNVLEVWAGAIDHLAFSTVDVAGLHGATQVARLAELTLPTSRVLRAVGALVVPQDAPSTHRWRWRHGEAEEQWTIVCRPAPRVEASPSRWPRALIPLAAALGELEHGSRSGGLDAWLEAESQIALLEGNWSYEVLSDSLGLLLGLNEESTAAASAASKARLEGSVRHLEAALEEVVVELEVLAVPEDVARESLGRPLLPGDLLPPTVRATWLERGGTVRSMAAAPLLLGHRTGLRVGNSVAGTIDADVNLAEAAAAISPRTWAVFEGLFATVSARRAGQRVLARVSGEVAWANPRAGRIVWANAEGGRPAPLPLLSGGSAAFQGEFAFDATTSERRVVAIFVGAGEVMALVASIAPSSSAASSSATKPTAGK